MHKLRDFGPLSLLLGCWQGDKGVDIAPEDNGPEENRYRERLVFEAVGDVDNADEQALLVVRYHQHIHRIRDINCCMIRPVIGCGMQPIG